MVEMTCEEHDQLAASTQFITHTVGRTLGAMQVRLAGRVGGGCAVLAMLRSAYPHGRLAPI